MVILLTGITFGINYKGLYC